MGHKALSKMQLGQETTQGTAVAADFIWRGPFAGLQDARETNLVDEDIGIALPSSRNYAASEMAEWAMPAQPLTPEQAPHIFEAGIKQVNSGVADGVGSNFIYEYPFPKTALNTISTYTIETGDEDQAEEAEFCFVTAFTITAVRGETVQISSEWVGRQVENAAFTAALSAPAVSHIHASNGTLYIDDNTGAFGGTQIAAGNILETTLNVTTGQVALFTIDSGELYFHGVYFNKDAFEATLEVKWVHSGDAVAERTKWQSDTQRLMRLEFLGDAVATPGTVWSNKAIQINFPGAYTEFSAVEHEEGKSIVTATLAGGYDNTSAEGLALTIVNELASLT